MIEILTKHVVILRFTWFPHFYLKLAFYRKLTHSRVIAIQIKKEIYEMSEM